jgi:predicted phosphodiesterase
MPSNKPARNYLQDFIDNPKPPDCKYDSEYLRQLSAELNVAYGTLKHHWLIHKETARAVWNGDMATDDALPPQQAPPATGNKQEWSEKDTTAIWSYDGTDNINTLEDALSFAKVNLDIWEVDRHIFNKWPTTAKNAEGKLVQMNNIQVKVWFKKRIDAGIDWQDVFDGIQQHFRNSRTAKRKPKPAPGNGVAVVGTADFHFGAYVDDLLRSDKFNIEVLVDYLERAADTINANQYKEVHLALLGDFIESFTGLNHRNSWKGLGKGMYGMNSIILCFEILLESFVQRINNVAGIYLVSGNHDRVTSEKENDAKGEVAELLAYLFRKELPHVDVQYHPMVLSVTIDGIQYVMTHGHLPFAQKELSKVLFDYGKQGIYNVLMQGHLHSRSVKKTVKRKQYEWNEVKVVQLDEADYRAVILPPMFTGNFYSEALGFSSTAGFVVMRNNGRGKPHYFDYCL